MEPVENRLPEFIIRARWTVVVLSIVLVALAANGVKYLAFTQSYRTYFGPEDPNLVSFESLERTYTKDDSIVLILAPADRKVFKREFLALLEKVTERAWRLPYVNRVDSITNFQHTEANGDDLAVGDLIKNAEVYSDEDLEQRERIAFAEPTLRNMILADDGAVTAINLNVLLPGVDEINELPLVIKETRALIAEIEASHPDVDIYLSGMTAMHNATSESAQKDMLVLTPVSFLVMFLLIAFLAGGLVGTISILFVFTMSVAAAMGISGYLGFPITPTGAGAPNIILTVAVANSVHVLVSYLHGLRNGMTKNGAIQESIRINLSPVALASVTTAIGFATMNFSVSPPIQQMGTTIAIGVGISFILTVTFLPALLSVLPTSVIRKESTIDHFIGVFGAFVLRRRTELLCITTGIIIALLACVPRNHVNEVFFQWFDKKTEFRISTDFMLDNLTGLYQIHYSLDSQTPGGISNPEFLAVVDEFAEWWRSQSETEHVKSIADTMKRLNKNMHGDSQDMYALPESRELAAQYLLLYEMSLPYGLDLNNQINIDKSMTRIVATLKPISLQDTLRLASEASEWLSERAPEIKHPPGSGMVVMATHMTLANIENMIYGTTTALALVSIVIVIALRSFRIGALSFLANLAPIGMGYGIWSIIDGEIGMGLSIVGSMTFGIVVDDTVHFLSKYLRARREQKLPSEEAVVYAFRTVGRALIVTSLVLVAGFLVLSTSLFAVNAKMGLSVAIVIACALFTVLLFLPPLLMKLDRRVSV